MELQRIGIHKQNWFYIALICFVLVLPFSEALVSVFSGVLFCVALVEDKKEYKIERLKQRRFILFVPVIFLLYLISTFFTLKADQSFYDVKKTMFYMVLPFAFALGKEITETQKRYVFFTFATSIFIATLTSICNWKFADDSGSFHVHNSSLISHIRFSFQIILVLWFFIFYLTKTWKLRSQHKNGFIGLLVFYFICFLLFQQSLTGLIAFGCSLIFYCLHLIVVKPIRNKPLLIIFTILLVVLPVIYVAFVVNKFYTIESVNPNTIIRETEQGNPYQHNFNNKAVENGRYVHLYVCTKEMREEWNKVSNYKYDSVGINGYPVYSTVKRYLTSIGVNKDAQGVKSLSTKDINNIENGMANVIYSRKYSIYPRIYQTVWEYYTYSGTGYVNHQSFSQRMEFTKAALLIVKDNFWFGVGTGNWKNEFAQAFQRMNSQLDKSLYASSHNQYLNFIVKFGLLGLLLILSMLILPIVKTRSYKDELFQVFLVFMFFANFGDSNLESHMGSSFFLFFYCLFVTTYAVRSPEIHKSKND